MTVRSQPWLTLALCIGLAAGATAATHAQDRQTTGTNPPLPTGKHITPTGQQAGVGSFPAGLLLSPDGKYLVVTNTGARQFLSVLSAGDGKLVSQLAFNGPRSDTDKSKAALYLGLAFAPSPNAAPPFTLYVSRGPEDRVSLYTLDSDGKLTDTGREIDDPSPLPKEAGGSRPHFLAGIALSRDGGTLYAAHNETSNWTHQRGSVGILDANANKVLATVETPGFPLAVVALTQGAQADRKIYVASERDSVVSAIDVSDKTHPKLVHNIGVGAQPMALCLDKAQNRLFVANAGSDTVSVIDTETDKVTNTILLRPEQARGLPGATPTGLALSPDETRLYVSLGDMNAVAVVDLKSSTLAGFIPSGWYPSAVAVTSDGTSLFVANAKGEHPHNPNNVKVGPNGEWGQYIQDIIEGTVAMLPVPSNEQLEGMTARAVVNSGLPRAALAKTNGLLPPEIKHIVYIIKENRTYDQVLGDMPQGNGDPSIVMFGKEVTPNQHALAERFVLLDNFYCSGEVSADGWNWSTAGMASEYVSRNVPFNYGGHGRNYDFEGENNGVPVDLLKIPDVARPPSGYLWDNCARHGVSFRNYGFFVTFGDSKRPDGKPLATANMPAERVLEGRTDVNFLRFALEYADSNAWQAYNTVAPGQRTAYGKFNAPSRFAEWKREFDGYVQNNNLPALMLVRFPCDHTEGTTPGTRSARAMVADNDYAVGQLVETISKSKYWKETAIFIVEDDAQDGYDHVDAHRSTCYVISPYIKSGTVDHHFYNTDSILHTMEMLLGLPTTSQYDAIAPVFSFFGATPDNADAYTAVLPAREIIGEVNAKTAYRAEDSRKMDFSRADQAPEDVLNDILWHAIKGANTPAPPVRHTLRLPAAKDDE
jgi:YVTN family beta-propeller protein